MKNLFKYIVPLGLGIGAAILVWRMTRGTETTTASSGVKGMHGITQGSGYAYRSISQTMISQGLQRQAFRK